MCIWMEQKKGVFMRKNLFMKFSKRQYKIELPKIVHSISIVKKYKSLFLFSFKDSYKIYFIFYYYTHECFYVYMHTVALVAGVEDGCEALSLSIDN